MTTRILDALGDVAAESAVTVDLGPNAILPVDQMLQFTKVHTWNGRNDPYVYNVVTEVAAAGARDVDSMRVPLGLRTIRVDADKGFFLNGKPFSVHGVNLHLDRPGVSLAVTDDNLAEDFQTFEDMGVTGLRLVHFQHPQKAYDLADEAGLVVWTEIPFNSKVGYEPLFLANLKEQLQELIRQNYNHPSVIAWGLGNEVYAADDATNDGLGALQALAKVEDPSRPTITPIAAFPTPIV